MFCRKCGNEISDDSIFCGKCGFKQNEQIYSPSQPGDMSFRTESHTTPDSTSDSGKAKYFDHSVKTISNLVAGIVWIVVILIMVTFFINGQIAKLEGRAYIERVHDAINQLETMRNFNILFDVLMIGGLMWRSYLTNKNHLRISGDMLDGVCCPLFGFTTITVENLMIRDIQSVMAKNNNTLVITADKKYIFLIENAKKAAKIISRKMSKE